MRKILLCVVALAALLSGGARPLLAQEAFDVTADRLVGTSQGNDVILEGHVKITHGTTIATADSGFYQKQAELISLVGNVVVLQNGIEVRGSRGEYLKTLRRAVFPSGVEVLDGGAKLTADRGTYDIAGDSLDARGHVAYAEGMNSMEAARVTYLRSAGSIVARDSVVMRDDDYGAVVSAGRVIYFRDRDYGVARDHPVLEILAREGREAMTVAADSMELFAKQKRAIAIGDVSIAREKTRGHCGRAEFLDLEDTSFLTENPTLTQGESSVSGDSITVYSTDEQISKVVVLGRARCFYRPEDKEGSELDGSEIVINFAEGEISEMEITGGATGIFLPAPSDTSGTSNEVNGTKMILKFEGGEVKTAIVVGKAKGLYRIEGGTPRTGASQGPSGSEGGTGEGGAGEVGPPVSDPPAVDPADSSGGAVPDSVRADSVRTSAQNVSYEADSIHYDVPGALMDLMGSAVIVYGGMRLESRAIEYDSRTDNLFATENPVLYEGQDKITGESMSYNLKTRRGAIVLGRTVFDKGIYTGRLIRKISESTLNVQGGVYTTCNYLSPHYSFASSEMKIRLDDMVVARPVVLKIRELPVLALPFYMFPIKRGRHSGILIPSIELGFDQTKGRFIRNAGYYWAPSDYFDVAAWGDYYQKSRWVGHAESRYNVRYLLSGSFQGSFTKELDTDDSRWDVSGSHTQIVGQNGRLVTHADFVSDKTYRKDTSDNLEEALRRVLSSDVSYSGTWNGKSINLSAQRRENLDTDEISENLPIVKLLLTRKTLFAPTVGGTGWHKGTYMSANSTFNSLLNKKSGVTKTQQTAIATINLDTDLGLIGGSQSVRSRLVLSGVRQDLGDWCAGCTGGKLTNGAGDLRTDWVARLNAFGWVNVNPSFTTTFTLYNRDKAGNRFPLRFLFLAGLDSRTTLTRTYFPKIGPLTALRHTMTPSVTFAHRPDFSKYANRFWTIPGISSEVGKSSTMSLSLANRLQAKIGSGAETRKIDDLFSLITSTTYDFLYKDYKKKTPFSTILNSMRFYPSDYVTFDLDFSNDPVDLSLKSLDFQSAFNYTGKNPMPPGLPEPEIREEPAVPEEGVGGPTEGTPTNSPWRFSVAYRYTKAFDGGEDSYWIEFLTGFNLTRNWRIDYGGRFDLSGHQTVYQEYALYRDLHCWEARFVRRYSNGEWEYYFRLNIKALPEIYAERGLRALFRSY